ncbi:hypothetical protein J7E71_18985 [Mesobacillus foraminis]|uniref:hypothetical protein n=1 Tax=Mesobacillus foraminis TaxID=279826 RepID=UPI001BE85E84|nr:hypothetical protein [Mesobacillus foraminis]MBT2757960.1 hypothetical protein [Mesobacillus foraminis]
MKKCIQLISLLILGIIMGACSSSSANFDSEEEQKKATEVMEGVLTSFEDQEEIAEAWTSHEANVTSWDKIKKKNINAISDNLSEKDQRNLLYLLTLNKAEDIDGKTKSNILFTQNTEINNTSLNEEARSVTFEIERSGIEKKLVTLEKEEDQWKIIKVIEPD